MSNINEIVDVTIEIESPAVGSQSFSDLLIVLPAATQAGTGSLSNVTRLAAASELTEYGYTDSDTGYRAVAAAFAQNPGPSYIYAIARGTVTDDSGGEPVTTNESIATTLNRAIGNNVWYGFALAEATDLDLSDAATWAESNGKLFGFTWSTSACPIDVTSYDHTFAVYGGDVAVEGSAAYSAIALMAKCFSYQPGKETWAHKTLAGISPSQLTAAKITTLEGVPSNYYYRVANKNITMNGKTGSGEWIDIIRFKDWLLNEIQIQEFNYLTANPKVPFNDDGITGVQNILENVLRAGQTAGGIDVDRTNEDTGEYEPGYKVTVPKAYEVSKEDRKLRKLRNVYFEARLAGAIHTLVIRGALVY